MSGIVVIANTDQTPVEQGLLREMTRRMAFRGPDAQETWLDSHVGLGHAMLRTTFDVPEEQQPRSLDGRVWITADARIDGRKELIDKLKSRVSRQLAHANDADLILHAYQVWDANCVHHLLGDFAFAIWDAPRRRLFCARDHFGIRPFYYADVPGCLIVSNNLDTIREHPSVSDQLNDLAIVNLLLFHYQSRIDQTSFADIKSLLPAHTLVWEGGETTISRYWSLPIEVPIYYKRWRDYVDHFRELLDTAVVDRMRTDRAGIAMSGGMDSSSIAATIHSLRMRKESSCALKAFTYVYDRLIPDEERLYATLVGACLDLPIHFEVLDDKRWFDGWDREDFRFPEPRIRSALWNYEDCIRKASLDEGVRVFYSGLGPDVILNEPTRYVTMLRHGSRRDIVRQVGSFIMRYRQRPLAGARQCWQRLSGRVRERSADIDAIALLAHSIAERIDIPKRFRQLPNRPKKHPWRPSAYSQIIDVYWPLTFQAYDAANWRAPIEFRYPYFDIRLVQYLLRVPALPSFSNKALLREAMRGLLPERVRTRPKAPVPGEANHYYADWVHRNNTPGPQLAQYVEVRRVTRLLSKPGSSESATIEQRLFAIDHWLRRHKQQLQG